MFSYTHVMYAGTKYPIVGYVWFEDKKLAILEYKGELIKAYANLVIPIDHSNT